MFAGVSWSEDLYKKGNSIDLNSYRKPLEFVNFLHETFNEDLFANMSMLMMLAKATITHSHLNLIEQMFLKGNDGQYGDRTHDIRVISTTL